MATQSRAQLEALMGNATEGVVYGFHAPDPGNSLTLTYSESLVRLENGSANPPGLKEYRLAAGTNVCTASRDTYAYVDGTTGAIGFQEVALNAVKPVIGGPGDNDIAARSIFLAKVVTDASWIASITDLRQFTGNVQTHAIPVGFETADVGAHYWVPRVHARVLGLDSRVINALAATDAGTVVPYVVDMGGTATEVTNATISHAASAAIATRDLELTGGQFYINEMDEIYLLSAKATAGGCCMVTLILEIL